MRRAGVPVERVALHFREQVAVTSTHPITLNGRLFALDLAPGLSGPITTKAT
jgi:hypothetical protein